MRFLDWLEDRRKFNKRMMEQAKTVRDRQYYLGRMNEAKMILTRARQLKPLREQT